MRFSEGTKVNGKSVDVVGIGGEMVATIEFSYRSGRMRSDWWFSGLNTEGELLAIARFTFGLGDERREPPIPMIEWVYENEIKRILESYARFGGFTEDTGTGTTSSKLLRCLTHLDGHQELGHIGESVPKRIDTARQFQLIKSLGYSAAQKLISERSDLPRSTVDRRLFLARESGLLKKISDLRDAHD